MTLDVDALVARCRSALQLSDPLGEIAEVVRELVTDSASLSAHLDPPLDVDDDGVLFRDDDLLVALSAFPAGFRTGIHEHCVPAVIGVWRGFEDNVLYREVDGALRESSIVRVTAGEVLALAATAIHEVRAPHDAWTGGIHVYLGDMVAAPRRGWSDIAARPAPLDSDDMHEKWAERALATGLAVRT